MTVPTSVEPLVVSAAAGAVVAFVVTALVVPLTIGLARRWGIIDEPGARSSHTVATPRLGGIGVMLGALAGLTTAAAIAPWALSGGPFDAIRIGVALAGTALLFGAIGLTDDLLRGIPVSVRLVAQVTIGTAAVLPWLRSADRTEAWTGPVVALAVGAVAAMWMIGYVNAFNFMDGIDGISGAVAIVVGIDLVLIGAIDDRAPLVVAGAVLVGAAAAFLRLNLRPATVFLGDGGSYFLGAWIAMAVVIGVTLGTPAGALLAVTVPYLADTSTTLARRIARGADWRASHHEHAYQQLIDLGASHRSVAGLVAGVSALCAVLGLVSLDAGSTVRVLLALAVVAVAVAYVAAPGFVRRRRHAVAPRPADVPTPPPGHGERDESSAAHPLNARR